MFGTTREERNARIALVAQYEIRRCTQCTALIANSLSYGRKPSEDDPNLCECCEYVNRPPLVWDVVDSAWKIDGRTQ